MKRRQGLGAYIALVITVGALVFFLLLLYHDAGVKQRAVLAGLQRAQARGDVLSVRMPEGYRVNIGKDGSVDIHDPEGVLGGPQY